MPAANLETLAAERGLSYDEVAEALAMLPSEPAGALVPAAEAQLLEQLGVGPAERASGPALAGILHRQHLERASLTTRQAAALLERDESRIRQRLDGPNRSLLGFHRRSGRREWLLPQFQFELGLHDLTGWARLLQALPPADDTSPTALVAWLTRACPHLDGRTRAHALADGYDVDTLVAEAATFGMAP